MFTGNVAPRQPTRTLPYTRLFRIHSVLTLARPPTPCHRLVPPPVRHVAAVNCRLTYPTFPPSVLIPMSVPVATFRKASLFQMRFLCAFAGRNLRLAKFRVPIPRSDQRNPRQDVNAPFGLFALQCPARSKVPQPLAMEMNTQFSFLDTAIFRKRRRHVTHSSPPLGGQSVSKFV